MEKRAVLVDAVSREVRPFILGLGFELDQRPKEERSWRWKHGAFFRRRDGYVDEVSIQWDKYGRSRFIINFWTSQAERMDVALRYVPRIADGPMARIYPARLWLALGVAQTWFGREKSVEKTVEVTLARLADLDRFLRTGAPTVHLDWRMGRFKDRPPR